MKMTSSITWIIWVVAGSTFILLTRNPVYLVFGILSLLFLGHQLAKKQQSQHWAKFNLRFIFMMVFLSTLINSLFSKVGQTVLLTLPIQWPLIGGNITVLIGGNITVESLVYGAINGLVISALYLIFNVLNLGMNIQNLVRLIPRAFHPIAMTISIALTFFPSINLRVNEIKEAQFIRGNPMKRLVDWTPILMPLLVTSLENAILLSESMTAKGYHQIKNEKSNLYLIGFVLSAFAIFSGWILHLYQYPLKHSIILYLIGLCLILGMIFTIGRNSQFTRYRQEVWNPGDYFVSTLMSLYLASFVLLSLAGFLNSSTYSPYPLISIPELQMLGLIFPIVLIFPLFSHHHD